MSRGGAVDFQLARRQSSRTFAAAAAAAPMTHVRVCCLRHMTSFLQDASRTFAMHYAGGEKKANQKSTSDLKFWRATLTMASVRPSTANEWSPRKVLLQIVNRKCYGHLVPG